MYTCTAFFSQILFHLCWRIQIKCGHTCFGHYLLAHPCICPLPACTPLYLPFLHHCICPWLEALNLDLGYGNSIHPLSTCKPLYPLPSSLHIPISVIHLQTPVSTAIQLHTSVSAPYPIAHPCIRCYSLANPCIRPYPLVHFCTRPWLEALNMEELFILCV